MIAAATVSGVAAIFFTAWAALIVQCLASRGAEPTRFEGELHFHAPPENDDDVILDEDFVFVDSNGIRLVAPKGLESDGASVGALMNWPVLGLLTRLLIKGGPLEGPLRPGAIIHDALYAMADCGGLSHALICSYRARADRVIFEASQCQTYKLGEWEKHRIPLASWRAFVVMALLRLFGAAAWIGDSKASRSLASMRH